MVNRFKHCLYWGGISFWLGLLVTSVSAQDLSLRAQLVWGTHDANPEDKSLTAMDANTKEKLRGVFKWPHYFVVGSQEFSAPKAAVQSVKMSSKCRLEVTNLGKEWVQVKLFGKSKPEAKEELVVTKKEQLKKNEFLVVAGDDLNDTAWFVMISKNATR